MRFSRTIAAAAGVLLTLLVFASSAIAQAATSNQQAAAHADRGLQLARSGNLASAEAELQQAVDLAPSNSGFLASLGTVLAMDKKLDDSTRVFKRALQLAPHDLVTRRYLAASLWQLHRYPEARQNLNVILKQKPDDPPTLLLFGMVCENMRDYASAAKALAAVPTLVREQPESIAALARSYYHVGQTAKARATLQLLLAHPAGAQGALLGAHIADEMRDYDTAEKLLVTLKPGFADQSALTLEVATVLYHARKFQESEKALTDLILAGHATGKAFNLLAWNYDAENQPQQAAQALEEAIQLESDAETNYLDLGNILLAHHLLPAALDAARRATARFPDSARAFLLKGSVEYAVSQFSDAVASFARAAELDPTNPDAALGLARSRFAAGEADKAAANFEAGEKRFPKDARFRLQHALLLLKESETGRPEAEPRAEALLKSALALDRSSPDANYQLGELALKKGDTSAAMSYLTSAAKLNPNDARIHFGLAYAYRRLGRKEDASKEMDLYQRLNAEPHPEAQFPARAPEN